MKFPKFLQQPGSHSPDATSASGGGAGSRKLNFVIQTQVQNNWCWAAVSASMSAYYAPTTPWTQCLVASATLTLPGVDCCRTPAPCDKPYFLDSALTTTQNLKVMLGHRLSLAEIQSELKNNYPVGCRVGWYGPNGRLNGSGHFMVIFGWHVGANGRQYINIADPIYLYSEIAYDMFAMHYEGGSGEWTHSYLTKPPSAPTAMALAGAAPQTPSAPDFSAIGA